MATLIDLSHPIHNGMPTYPGFPAPRIGAFWTHEESRSHYEGKAEFLVSHYEMVGSLGTYMDSPFHRHKDRMDLSRIPLERVADLPGFVVDVRGNAQRGLGADLLEGTNIRGCSVLFRTDWSDRWGTERYWEPAPFISDELCKALVDGGAYLVGVDFWNVDNTEDPSRPAHTGLLAADILIVENMANLSKLPISGFRFHAAPLPIASGSAVPVRAYAVA